MKDAKPHPLDGLRPRHTLCPACGYLHGGLEIRGGVIQCPECGAATTFDPPRSARARRPPKRVTLWLMLGIALVMGVLYFAR